MSALDMTPSIIPKSDQINAEDFLTGPATYTIKAVKAGSVEQPFDFLLVESERCYRPSKTMRRVIVNAWGPEAANYAGRRLTLYREPTIKFGGVEVGGIRISHMSHISGTIDLMAQTTRGRREKFTVQPLSNDSGAPKSAAGGRDPKVPHPTAEADTQDTSSIPQDDNDLPFEPVTQPVVAKGQLRAALSVLNPHQKDTLFKGIGVDAGAGTTLGAIRSAMLAKWAEYDLHELGESEPVPVTLLGAIYAHRERPTQQDVEAFDHEIRTGQELDAGDQAVIA